MPGAAACGIISGWAHSKDLSYGEVEPERMPLSSELRQRWDAWVRGGALCSEMELSALFVVASVLGARAGGLMVALDRHQPLDDLCANSGRRAASTHPAGYARSQQLAQVHSTSSQSRIVMESLDLIVLGDLVADLIIPIERLPLLPLQHGWAEGIFVEPGGAGNVLVAARRMNLKTLTLGAIGPDRYGSEMLTMLADEGVIVEHVAICDERTTVVCIVLADQQGQHVYLGMKDKLGRWPFLAHMAHAHPAIPRALHRRLHRARCAAPGRSAGGIRHRA